MVRRIRRLLISTAFLAALITPGATALADNTHGNSANAPGQTKTTNTNSTTASNTTSSNTSSIAPGNSNHSQGNAGTSGTYNQPQPYSKADNNNTGANDTSSTNPYKSTRDGSPSMNGNGGGQSTGKPCAGCVGKADNKNPKGQQPGPSDNNKGYECDGNNGIGKSNPAHTGCTSTPGCTTNCGGMGGCTSDCDNDHGCKTDCNNDHHCTTNCEQNVGCTLPTVCTGGRGGDEEGVLGASTVVGGLGGGGQVLGASTELPNTGLQDSASFWGAFAIVAFIAMTVYWRQAITPLLPRR